MIIALSHLVDRARHQRERANELLVLRRRLASLPGASESDADVVELARELRRVRERLSGAFDNVESCSICAVGHPLPFGHWPGGHCCGGRTSEIFSTDELAALKLGGLTPRRLRAPRSDLAGCAFRGPTGCSLEPAHRPSLCLRYTCRQLEAELEHRADARRIRVLKSLLRTLFDRFVKAREARPGLSG